MPPDPPPLPPAEPSDTAATTPPEPAPAVLFLFDVESRAEGSFRPGEPLRIVADVRARLPVDTAEVAVVMPEVAAARASEWGEEFQHLPVGVRYPAIDSLITPLRPERPLRLETTLTLPAPGYYQVLVSARARSFAPDIPRRVPVQDIAHHDFWIWIDESGGYATREYDPTRLPLGADPEPGPLRYSARTAPLRELLESGRRDPRSHAMVRGVVRGPDGAPAANTMVHVRAYVERCPGRAAAEETVRTDAAGGFHVRLGSYYPRGFTACVAVHVDPLDDAGSHVARRDSIRFTDAGAPPDTLAVDLVLEGAP